MAENVKTKAAGKSGKRMRALKENIDSLKFYTLEEAVPVLKQGSTVKFDEAVEIAVMLGVDPRHSDQMVRGVVSMPNGTGKKISVAVFARGDKAEEAKKAGADLVGAEDLIEQIKAGQVNFDRCIATPDMMAVIGSVAKVLGPKGLMPNPKLGTVTMNVAEAVQAAKSGQVEFRVDKAGIVHAGIGKISFSPEALIENIKAFVNALNKAKPTGVKGTYFKSAYLSSTMGVGLKIELNTLLS